MLIASCYDTEGTCRFWFWLLFHQALSKHVGVSKSLFNRRREINEKLKPVKNTCENNLLQSISFFCFLQHQIRIPKRINMELSTLHVLSAFHTHCESATTSLSSEFGSTKTGGFPVMSSNSTTPKLPTNDTSHHYIQIMSTNTPDAHTQATCLDRHACTFSSKMCLMSTWCTFPIIIRSYAMLCLQSPSTNSTSYREKVNHFGT